MRTKLTFLQLLCILAFSTGSLMAQDWALKFDASNENSYVNCGTSESFSPSNLTLEAWFFIDTWVPNGNYILASEGWTEASGPMGYCIRLFPDIGVDFVLGLGADNWGQVSSGYETIDTLKWYHVACTFDGELMAVYLNGELMLDQEVNGSIFPSTESLILGEGAMWRGRRFSGKIYDVRLWNVARTEEQIASHMNISLTGEEEGLVANWKADEGTGNILADATGKHPASVQSGVQWYSLSSTKAPLVNQDSPIMLFPNPATNYITLANLENSNLAFTIYNIIGKAMVKSVLQTGETRQIETGHFPKGMYLMKLDDHSNSRVQKFIVK